MSRRGEKVDLAIPVSEHDHMRGPMDAPVTLVEYGDYQCPYCGKAHPIIEEIRRRMGDDLLFVFRNFPLTQIHPNAEHAAEAAEAAGAQDHFWEMHDLLYERQFALDDENLLEYAAELELDVPRLVAELEQGTYRDRVRDDFRGGVRSGVNGTPTFYINGLRHDGSWELEALLSALQSAVGI